MYDPTTNKMSKFEAQKHFKLMNDAYEYICILKIYIYNIYAELAGSRF